MTRTARLMQASVGLRKVCAVINPELDRLARARYVSLTTFRRDGAGVASPVWVASEGGYLQVLAGAGDGRVKRVRRDPRVTVAPCDPRGNLLGDPAEATATVVDDPALIARVEHLMRTRYGPAARIMQALDKARRRTKYVVIAIDVPEDDKLSPR